MSKFDNVTVEKEATIYFDGRCVSHTVLFADGTRKTLGVIMPGSQLTFNVNVPELMEITSGSCQIKIGNEPEYKTYSEGDKFSISANGHFMIDTKEVVNYVCSYG
ncbi:MAG: pyrimidine/purine nucleoside phosphorylase [Gallionella sp.]